MKVKEVIKDITIALVALIIVAFMFMGAVLQDSYRKCPPTQSEIDQMGAIERWIYGK